MPTNCPRPSRPLNPQALTAADNALYSAHQDDAKPNALYDAAGNKRPLSPTDPSQECLRDEWVELYAKNGGKVEKPKPKGGSAPGSTVVTCPCAKLQVSVRYAPLDGPVNHAKVTLKGPYKKTIKTDAAGIAQFANLPPGNYEVTAEYDNPNTLVDRARSHVGSTLWAVANARAPLPKGANKCNLFVFEMVTGAGYTVPQKPHKKLYGIGATVMLPPNAGDWANASSPYIPFGTTAAPEPGDIAAWRHDYSDATGHVAIVSYPLPSTPQAKAITAGISASITITMRRQVIGANDATVDEDDKHFWHYYDEVNMAEIGNIIYRRPKK